MQWHPKPAPARFARMALADTVGRQEMLLAARAAGLRYVDPADPGIGRSGAERHSRTSIATAGA